jgi:hypothetical protein
MKDMIKKKLIADMRENIMSTRCRVAAEWNEINNKPSSMS